MTLSKSASRLLSPLQNDFLFDRVLTFDPGRFFPKRVNKHLLNAFCAYLTAVVSWLWLNTKQESIVQHKQANECGQRGYLDALTRKLSKDSTS